MLKKLSFAVVSVLTVLTMGAQEVVPASVEAGEGAALVLVQELPPAGTERAEETPELGVAEATSPEAWSLELDPMSKAVSVSCGSSCQALYGECLDDCDSSPFPGCYNFCRFDVLYPCYKSCLGG